MRVLKKSASGLSKVLPVLFLLFLFLLAIQLLGDSFKLLGEDFSLQLIKTTSNPFVSLFVGIIATALVQSSSVTTSVVVGLVSAGGLPVEAAVPMIMGANIGTTVTNIIVSLGHISRSNEFERAFAGATMHDFFNVITVIVLLPLELMTGFLQKMATMMAGFFYGFDVGGKFQSPVKALVKPPAKAIKHLFLEGFEFSSQATGIVIVVISFVLIFTALYFLVKVLKSAMMQNIKHTLDKVFSSGTMITMLIGMMVTIMVQSSSITTSIMVPMIATGILSLEHAFPLTLGANVGTTVTALLAALVGNVAGLTIAFVHLLFNLTGIALIFPVKKIRQIPINLSKGLAKIAVERRVLAVFYVIFLFFILPLLCIFVSRVL